MEKGDTALLRSNKKDSRDEASEGGIDGGLGGDGDRFRRRRDRQSQSACCDIMEGWRGSVLQRKKQYRDYQLHRVATIGPVIGIERISC